MTPTKARLRLESSAVHLLHRAGQAAAEIFTAEMGTEGLTPRQLAILLTISENEGVSQTELVSRTGIDRSTLADVIRRMIKKSLIQRKRTRQDARAYAVKLTDVGRKALDDAEPVARRVDDQLMQMLPVAQRASFLTSLAALTELLNETAGRKDR